MRRLVPYTLRFRMDQAVILKPYVLCNITYSARYVFGKWDIYHGEPSLNLLVQG